MIWSVSTLLRRSGSAVPLWVVNACICPFPWSGQCLARVMQVGGAREVACDGRRGGDRHGDQMGPAALALPPLEVAVRRRGAALPRRQLVGVHAQAHRATGSPPLATGLGEDLVETLGLGLQPDPHGTGDH